MKLKIKTLIVVIAIGSLGALSARASEKFDYETKSCGSSSCNSPCTGTTCGSRTYSRTCTYTTHCASCWPIREFLLGDCDCASGSTRTSTETGAESLTVHTSGSTVCVGDESYIPVPRPPSVHVVDGQWCWTTTTTTTTCDIVWHE